MSPPFIFKTCLIALVACHIDDCVVAVLVVRRIDGVVLINDKTDPSLLLPRAVDCPADESKGGAVAELARNASNPGKGGRLVARDFCFSSGELGPLLSTDYSK
jgi:hypothetical protein